MSVWIDKFKSVGDIIVQYDPGHAALPWAAVRFILQAAINDIQTNAAIIEGLELTMNLIAKYETIEILYLHSPSKVKAVLEKSIVKLYVTLLTYLVQAHQYFSRSTISRMTKGLFQLENTTAEFLVNVKVASANVDQYLPLFSEESQQQIGDSITELSIQLTDINFQDLYTNLKSYDAPILRISSQLSAIQDNLRTDERVKIFEWLTTDEYQSHHRSKQKTLLPGSGEWLLQKPEFIEWQASSSSSILWLHGIPGSGKSMLISRVIDHLKDQGLSISSPVPIAFFYCARNANESERADPAHLMRTILEQLCSIDEDTPIREPVVNAYRAKKKESRGKMPGPLTMDETVNIISELLESNPAIIVLDGLDECDPLRRRDLLDALKTIMNESSNVVKVLVSSRDDQDLVHHLSQTPNIYIRAAENTKDIIRFVETRVSDAISGGRILQGSVSDDLRTRIIQTLTKKANGMFRLASLHIEALCDPSRIKTRSNIISILEKLPQDLKHSYDSVLNQIRESEEPNPDIADRIIKWLLYARSSLRANSFLFAVCSDYLVDEQVSQSEVLNICSNLVVFDEETKRFQFVHLSVQEYLQQRQEYSIENCNAQLARQCLSWLIASSWTNKHHPVHSQKTEPMPPETFRTLKGHTFFPLEKSNRAFTLHVDRFWAAYVKSAGPIHRQSPIKDLLDSFLLSEDGRRPSIHFNMWTKRKSLLPKSSLTTLPLWEESEEHLTPLQVASAFDFVEPFTSSRYDTAFFVRDINIYDLFEFPTWASIAVRYNSIQVLEKLLDETEKLVCELDAISAVEDIDVRHYEILGFVSDGQSMPSGEYLNKFKLKIQYYWFGAISVESVYGCHSETLSIVFGKIGGTLSTQLFLGSLISNTNYTAQRILHILPLLFVQNTDLHVTDEMLFRVFGGNIGEHHKDRMMLLKQLLTYKQDVVISKRLLDLTINHGDLEFKIIGEILFSDAKITFEPALVTTLMSQRNLTIPCLLNLYPEVDVANVRLPLLPEPDSPRARLQRLGAKENFLARFLGGRTVNETTITWKEMELLRGAKDGKWILNFVLQAKVAITPAAINTILAEYDARTVVWLLKYRAVKITDEVINMAARNIKYGEAIMRLLLDAESSDEGDEG